MSSFTSGALPAPVSAFRGHAVKVGDFEVLAGGSLYLQPQDLARADVLVPLNGLPGYSFGRFYQVSSVSRTVITSLAPGRDYSVLIGCAPDFCDAPYDWRWFLEERVIPLLQQGKTLLGFCKSGQGLTGTWLASLVALLEPETEDPIAAVRQRYCAHAVQCLAHARAVFALMGEDLPIRYQAEFAHWDD